MKVNAEPTPLREPLAGGTEGATVVIEPLKTGETLWPHTFFDRAGTGVIKRLRAVGFGSSPDTWESRPVPAFLVRHPSLGNILVDTGLHPSVVRNPRDKFSRLTARHYKIEEGEDIVSQLRDRGLAPSDIAFVVLTHLHEDHASGIEAFPDARFVFSATEWEGATTGSFPQFRGYKRVPITTSPSSTTRSTSTPTSSSRMGPSVAASTSSGMARSVLRTRPVTARATPR